LQCEDNDDAPLYLRHTWPFELQPLSVADLPAFFPAYTPDELVETYAVLGGLPYYLISVDPAVDLLTNIRRAILAPTGPLFNEIPLQLHLEMRGMDVPLYMRILQAIAQGSHTRAEIGQAAALQDKNLSHYLLTLQEMGLVTAQQPLARSRERQHWARYHLEDPFLRFWQRFVGPPARLNWRSAWARTRCGTKSAGRCPRSSRRSGSESPAGICCAPAAARACRPSPRSVPGGARGRKLALSEANV
jgi:AAA+ ATPase superfamily predicted ATPase